MSGPKLTELLAPTDQAETPQAHRDLCDLLGWMMQLQGTVRIAGLLDAVPPPAPPRPHDEPGELLASDWDWRIDAIERTALHPLRDPFHGKGALLDAAAAYAWLSEHEALGRSRSPALLRKAAIALGGELHQVVGERLAIVRAGMAELRRQLGKHVARLGSTPAYLELLDRTLREATETRTQELFARIAPELARRFTRLLAGELDALPDEPTPAHIDQWYSPDGWLLDHVASCRVALRAACGHEARALKGFIAAVDDMTAAEERFAHD